MRQRRREAVEPKERHEQRGWTRASLRARPPQSECDGGRSGGDEQEDVEEIAHATRDAASQNLPSLSPLTLRGFTEVPGTVECHLRPDFAEQTGAEQTGAE